MRQRGAAGRNTRNSNFRLSFGFGDDRNETQQIRQRVSGTKRIDATDFGLSVRRLGSRSRSGTPALGASNNRKDREASVRSSREPSLPLLRRSVSVQREGRDVAQGPDDRGSRSSKRRRTTLREVQQRQMNTSTRAENDILSKGISLGFPMSEDIMEEEADAPVGMNDNTDPGHGHSWSPTFVLSDNHDKENAEHITNKATKRKKRKPIGQQSTRKKKRSSSISILSVEHDEIEDEGRASSQADAELERVSEHAPSAKPPSDQEQRSRPHLRPVGSSKKAPPFHRKKRKSVVMPRKKRRSSENARRISARSAASPELTQDIPRMAQSLVKDGAAVSPRQRTQIPRAMSAGTQQDSPAVVRSIEVENASDDEYVDEEHSPEPPTPAPNKRPAKAVLAKKGSRIEGAINTVRRSKKSGFPITTYRMANIDTLPTIREENDLEPYSDNEPQHDTHRIHATNRAPANAIDILAQVCREVVANTVDHLATGDQHGTASRKRKRTALEAFGDDLDSRLFEMSAAVEDRLDLEGRSRKIKREKADLQSRWIEVRRQREQVALRCDRVRREHWEDEQEREEKWHVSESAYKAELELERGEPEEEESLEYLLRTVADEVSNRSEGGGLLNKIRSVNGQLQWMTGVLEGRTR